MSEVLYLDLTDDQLVLFADIIGFSDAVNENANVTPEDKGVLIVNFPLIYDGFNDKYSQERQLELGIKFLWVSDSIIITTTKEKVNNLFGVLVDLTNGLYCSGLSLRGAITLGKVHHKNNIWGPAYIEAVKTEGSLAIYPRVIINEAYITVLDTAYRRYFEPTETPEYMYFDFFRCYFEKLISEDNDLTSNLSVYGTFIKDSYNKATRPEHIEKYVWLAERLIQVIKRHSDYIDHYVAKHEKYRVISGTTTKLTSHKQFLEQLEPIKINKVRT